MTKRRRDTAPFGNTYRQRTLQEIEGRDWGEPNYPSHLVRESHRLRRVPIQDFTVEDLRLMIGQDIGTPYLVPLALEQLELNPFAEGDFYPGDLLLSVSRIPAEFWRRHPDLHQRASEVARRTLEHIRLRRSTVELSMDAHIMGQMEHFLDTEPSAR